MFTHSNVNNNIGYLKHSGVEITNVLWWGVVSAQLQGRCDVVAQVMAPVRDRLAHLCHIANQSLSMEAAASWFHGVRVGDVHQNSCCLSRNYLNKPVKLQLVIVSSLLTTLSSVNLLHYGYYLIIKREPHPHPLPYIESSLHKTNIGQWSQLLTLICIVLQMFSVDTEDSFHSHYFGL